MLRMCERQRTVVERVRLHCVANESARRVLASEHARLEKNNFAIVLLCNGLYEASEPGERTSKG